MNQQHTIEAEAAATYLDQFDPAQRSALAGLLFSQGGAMLASVGHGASAPSVEQGDSPGEAETPEGAAEGDEFPVPRGANLAILQVLAELSPGQSMTGQVLSQKTGYAHDTIRKRCAPSGILAEHWGLRNNGDHTGYYIDPACIEDVLGLIDGAH